MSGVPDLAPVPDGTLTPPYDERVREAFKRDLLGVDAMAAFVNFVAADLLPRDHKSVFWGDRLLTIDKAAGFLDDPAFKAALDAVRGSHVYDQYQAPLTIAWRLHTLVWAARTALALPAGDFVECGTFKGDMAWTICRTTTLPASGRRFHLFDSFEGFDPEQSRPEDFPDLPGYIDAANAHYRQPGLYEAVVARFIDEPCVVVHQGFLPAALDRDGYPERISFLHVDLNSARAEIACLDRLFPHVVPGGLIVFDDYGWKSYGAQRLAEDAFFAERGLSVLELPTGQGLVVKPAPPSGPWDRLRRRLAFGRSAA